MYVTMPCVHGPCTTPEGQGPYHSISYLIILHGGSHLRVVLLLAMSTWGWRLFKTLGLDSGLYMIN